MSVCRARLSQKPGCPPAASIGRGRTDNPADCALARSVLKRQSSMQRRVGKTFDTTSRSGAPASWRHAWIRQSVQRLAACCVLTALVLTSAPEAWGQTTTGLTLNETNIKRLPLQYSRSRPWWINYADCLANGTFTFALSLTSIGDPLEVWVGNDDCATNRGNTSERGQCWIVARDATPETSTTIEVPMRNVVARRLSNTEVPANVSADVCDDSDEPSGEALTFYFLLVESGKAKFSDSWTGGAQKTGFDVLGPAPPGGIRVGIGESQLAINIDGVDEEDDRASFGAYCAPADTPDTVFEYADAGGTEAATATESDAGSGDTGDPAPDECFTDVLRSRTRPPVGYECGVVNETSGTLRTNTLINNQPYAVGVAGLDIVGNAGPLSNIECGTPLPLDDFFELYSRNGGPGGGGFCDLSRTPARSAPHGFAALGLFLAGLAYRRSRGRA